MKKHPVNLPKTLWALWNDELAEFARASYPGEAILCFRSKRAAESGRGQLRYPYKIVRVKP